MSALSSRFSRPASRYLLWVLTGLLLWLVFVISQIPASWAAWAMTRSGQVGLTGVSGTLWQGRASLASFRVDQTDYSLGQLRWDLDPWTLLLLKPCAVIATELDRQHIDGKVCSGISGELSLHDTTISAPASLLKAAVPLPLDGQISAQIKRMDLQGDYLKSLQGNFSWTSAQINNGKNWMRLGSYAAELKDDQQGGIEAQVFHLDGPTQVDMQVHLLAGGGGSAKGSLMMSREFTREVEADAWISMFAQLEQTDAEGNNHYRVELEF